MDVRNIAAIRVLGTIVTESCVAAHARNDDSLRAAVAGLTMALNDFAEPTWQDALNEWGQSLALLERDADDDAWAIKLRSIIEECVDTVIAAAEGKGTALSPMRKLLRDLHIETGG